MIRGQRGLRVLFLEDGLRLNNARRQTDFGEITGLVDLDSVDTVEVVRGPASVLYGSDAIGGVLNLVTTRPRFGDATPLRAARLEVRYGSAPESAALRRPVSPACATGSTTSSAPSTRDAERLRRAGRALRRHPPRRTTPRCSTSGVRRHSLWGSSASQLNDRHDLRLRFNRYRADQTGFGFVDPEDYAPTEDFAIRILYPYQHFDRCTALLRGLGARAARSPTRSTSRSTARATSASSSTTSASRSVPLFRVRPSSCVDIDTLDTTDLDTTGLRASRRSRSRGTRSPADLGRSRATGTTRTTPTSRTTTIGFRFPFPPFEVAFVDSTDAIANAPNATNASWGALRAGRVDGERQAARHRRPALPEGLHPGRRDAGLGHRRPRLRRRRARRRRSPAPGS